MVGHDVDVTVAPPMELPDETREPLDFKMDVSNQRLCVAVTDVVHFFVAEDDEQLAQTSERRKPPRSRRCRGSRRRTPSGNSAGSRARAVSLPFTFGCSELLFSSNDTTAPESGSSAVIPIGVTVGSIAKSRRDFYSLARSRSADR